jgi:hypothetical protein
MGARMTADAFRHRLGCPGLEIEIMVMRGGKASPLNSRELPDAKPNDPPAL